MKLVYRAISLLLIALAVLFSLSNREPVTLLLWPLPDPIAPEGTPLFVVVLAALVVGFIAGALLNWANTFGLRARARKEIRSAEAHHQSALEIEQAAKQTAAPTVDRQALPSQ